MCTNLQNRIILDKLMFVLVAHTFPALHETRRFVPVSVFSFQTRHCLPGCFRSKFCKARFSDLRASPSTVVCPFSVFSGYRGLSRGYEADSLPSSPEVKSDGTRPFTHTFVWHAPCFLFPSQRRVQVPLNF